MDHFATTYRNNFNWEKHTIHKNETMKDNANKANKIKTRICMKDILSQEDERETVKANEEMVNPSEPQSAETTNENVANNTLIANSVSANPINSFTHNHFASQEQFMGAWMYPQMYQGSCFNPTNIEAPQPVPESLSGPDRPDDGDKKSPPPCVTKAVDKRLGMKELLCYIEYSDIKEIQKNNDPTEKCNIESKAGVGEEKLPSKKITMKDILYNSEPKIEIKRSEHKINQEPKVEEAEGETQKIEKGIFDAMTNDPTFMKNKPSINGSCSNSNSSSVKQICSFCGKEREIRPFLMGNMNGQLPPHGIVMESNIPYMSNMGNMVPPYSNFQRQRWG